MNPATTRRCVQIASGDLRPGMYVAALDRPWLETPFLFQGFHIRDDEDIKTLREYCEWVLVPIEDVPGAVAARSPPASNEKPIDMPAPDLGFFDEGKRSSLPVTCPVEDELEAAEPAHAQFGLVVEEAFSSLRSGKNINVESLREAAGPVVDSVGRNPDAMIWLSRMRAHGDYVYQHSVCTAVLAAALGRHLGLARPAQETLTLAVLIMDVGKIRLPAELLLREQLFGEREQALFRKHVAASVRLLRADGKIDEQVIRVAATHHEREDGSGYPRGLSGAQISPYAKIAGLVDTYDAMTSERGYARVYSAHDALIELNRQRGRAFEAALVEQFIQSIGIFPTGSMVELNSGEVGIVVEQNRVRRLQPKVMLVLDADKQPLTRCKTLDLMIESDLHGEVQLRIERPLAAGAYGIDPREYYL